MPSPSEPQSVWRSRDFRLVLVGSTVNDIGDWMLSLALPVYVFTATGSGRDTAIVFLIELMIGIALGPYGGSLADRWNLKRTIVTTNVLQAAALLPLLTVHDDRVWPVYGVAAAQALLQTVNNPASFALLPRVVDDDQLVQANAFASSGGSIARLVGAPLGGIAVGLGGLDTVVLVDALSFLGVAAATSFVRRPTQPLVHDDEEHVGIRAGWRAIRTHDVLVGYLVAQSLAHVAFAMFPILFIPFVVEELGGGGAAVGIIRGAAAVGGLTASLLVAGRASRADPARLMMWGYIGLFGVAVLFVNAPYVTDVFVVFLVLFALSGLPNATSQIGAAATAQHFCPPELRGRLAGVAASADNVGAAVGTVVAGLLVDELDIIPLFNAQALVFLACGLATYLLVVRRPDVG